jgi:hypothetical protein
MSLRGRSAIYKSCEVNVGGIFRYAQDDEQNKISILLFSFLTLLAAVFNLFPDLCPFFAVLERSLATDADFGWQILLESLEFGRHGFIVHVSEYF